jgi:hypothetical protein
MGEGRTPPRPEQEPIHLPSDRAFVVQFVGETGCQRGVHGRVEHVTSGQAIRFDSWTRLRRFVEARLRDAVRADEDDDRGSGSSRR